MIKKLKQSNLLLKKTSYFVVFALAFFVSNIFGFTQADARYESSVFVNFDRNDTWAWQNGERYLCEVGKYYWDCQEGLGNDLQIADGGGGNNMLVCSTQGTTVPATVQRSELRIIHNQSYGVTNFSKFSMKISDEYVRPRTTIFWQVHDGPYSPPISLSMEPKGTFSLKKSTESETGTVLFRDYLPWNEWHDYFVEYEVEYQGDGLIRFWMDNEKKMVYEGRTAFDDPDAQAAPIFTKFGIYRYSDRRDFAVYFDDAGWSKNTCTALWDASQMTESIPANGLIGQWMFDEPNSYNTDFSQQVFGSAAWDSSGGCSYVGNVRNGAVRTEGYIGRAIELDGVDDYVSIPDSNIWDTGSAVTVSCRFKTFSNQSGRGLVLHDNSNYKYLIYLTAESGDLAFYVRTSSGLRSVYVNNADGYYADGKWHHVAGVYDRYASDGRRIKLYVDGVLAGYHGGFDEDILDGDEGVYIGKWSGNYFEGTIDDVRIYNYGLNVQEVIEVDSSVCIGSWGFDENEGLLAYDSSTFKNFAQLINGVDWCPGYTGSAISCSSSNPYSGVEILDSSIWDVKDELTVSCRFKTFVNQTYKTLVVHDEYDYKYLLYLTGNSGDLTFYVRTASGVKSAQVNNADGHYADGQWHHIAGVYDKDAADGKRLKLYVDGVLVADEPGYNENILEGDEGIVIGRRKSVVFDGAIDDVAIYRVALDSSQIQYEYSDICPYEITGDFNMDCKVDYEDLSIMLENWLLDCTYPSSLENRSCYY